MTIEQNRRTLLTLFYLSPLLVLLVIFSPLIFWSWKVLAGAVIVIGLLIKFVPRAGSQQPNRNEVQDGEAG